MDGPELSREADDLYQDVLSAISLHTMGRGKLRELENVQQDVLARILKEICAGAVDTRQFALALVKIVCIVSMHSGAASPDDIQEMLEVELLNRATTGARH